MRSSRYCCIVLGFVMLFGWGCAGSRDAMRQIPTMINTVEPAKGFSKKIAIALTRVPSSEFGRHIGDLYFNALIDALRDEDSRLQLVTRTDAQWPDFLPGTDQEGPQPANNLERAEKARLAGLNGWACARIENLMPVARRTGILWFRKERYFIFAELSFSVYDACTGAMVVDKVVESSTSISKDDYNTMKSGKTTAIARIDDVISDIGEDMGEYAAKVLKDQPWQTAVTGVQGDRIYLSTGTSSGLQSGDRLAVFSGRRIIDGQDGERFVVPGPEVGEIEIVRVTAQTSEAKVQKASDSSAVQVGDIAVAVR
jgi:Flagellar assembly protein T, C-terminal domain